MLFHFLTRLTQVKEPSSWEPISFFNEVDIVKELSSYPLFHFLRSLTQDKELCSKHLYHNSAEYKALLRMCFGPFWSSRTLNRWPSNALLTLLITWRLEFQMPRTCDNYTQGWVVLWKFKTCSQFVNCRYWNINTYNESFSKEIALLFLQCKSQICIFTVPKLLSNLCWQFVLVLLHKPSQCIAKRVLNLYKNYTLEVSLLRF